MQRLDVSCFDYVAREYRKGLREKLSVVMRTIRRADFNDIYKRSRLKAMTKAHIGKGWSRSGLYPINREKILAKDQVRNYTHSRPNLVPAPTSKPRGTLQTPQKLDQARYLYEGLLKTMHGTAALQLTKLFGFTERLANANALYEERVEAVREEKKAKDKETRGRRGNRRPGQSFKADGVIQATYHYWKDEGKPSFEWSWKWKA